MAIVALDDKNRIAIEHQFRYPFSAELIEIPAGKLDYIGENPLSAAERELSSREGAQGGDRNHCLRVRVHGSVLSHMRLLE